MRLFLRQRASHVEEQMDDPACDLDKLRNTYSYFLQVNRTLGRWSYVYKKHIRPLLVKHPNLRLLDIGCGGGDILWLLSSWIKRDGLHGELMGIDPDYRAISFALTREYPMPVELRSCRTTDLLEEKSPRFDVVISNHVLHHLSDDNIQEFLDESSQLADKKVIHCDLERNDWAYLSYPVVSFPAHWNSFLVSDGLISIRKSFTRKELESIAGPGWQCEPIFPFRYALVRECELR